MTENYVGIITTDGYPEQTQERVNEYRLKQKKDGTIILQQKIIIKNYKWLQFQGVTEDWLDLETVKDEQ